MTKKYIIIILGLLLVLAITGLSIFFYKQNKINQPIETKTEQTVKPTENQEFVGSTFNCARLTDEAQQQACKEQLAKVLTTSKANCQFFSNEVDKNICEQSYVVKAIVASSSPEKCQELTDEKIKTDCISQSSISLAITKRDSKYCEAIINQADKSSCLKILEEMNIK